MLRRHSRQGMQAIVPDTVEDLPGPLQVSPPLSWATGMAMAMAARPQEEQVTLYLLVEMAVAREDAR